MEMRGIDPRASRMQSKRSTIETTSPKCTIRDSNPGRKNGSLTCYPYTNGALIYYTI